MKSRLNPMLLFVALLFATTAIHAQEQIPAPKAKPPEPVALTKAAPAASNSAKSAAEKYFSDVELLDQDGKTMKFYSDVLKNKVVIINAFFTTCTSVCPPMNRNFEKLQ